MMRKSFFAVLIMMVITTVLNAQWKQVSGPCGDGINTIVNNGTDLYAGTTAGLFLSANSGNYWKEIGPKYLGVNSIVFSQNGNTDTTIFISSSYAGVYLSTDKGSTWLERNDGFPYPLVYTLLSIPNNLGGTNLFAGLHKKGVYCSTNNGTSWTPSNNGLKDISVRVLAASSNGKGGIDLFAGTDRDGVFRSTDNGQNWVLAGSLSGIYALTVTPNDPSGTTLYAATSSGIYSSTNNGDKWEFVVGAYFNGYVPNSVAFIENKLYAGIDGAGVYSSTDNGITWNHASNDMMYNVRTLTAYGSQLFAGTTRGIYRLLNNEKKWLTASNGLSSSYVSSLAVQENVIFAGTSGGIYRFNHGDSTVNHVSTGETSSSISSLVVVDTNIFAGSTEAGVLISTDKGKNWKTVNSGLTDNSIQVLSSYTGDMYAGTSSGYIFLSTNCGGSWTDKNQESRHGSVTALLINDSNIFLGTSSAGIFRCLKSDNFWTEQNDGLLFKDVHALTISDSVLFSGIWGGLYKSTNNGESWTQSGFTNTGIFSLFVNDSIIVVGTTLGVYLSHDNGLNWSYSGIGYVYSITSCGDNLYVGTSGGGVYYRPISEFLTDVNDNIKQHPTEFLLKQNYPNPFNPKTQIEFYIAKTAKVNLKIFDMLGREIDILVNEEKLPGTYKVDFVSHNLPTGVYFYRIETPYFTQTKKLVLLK